MCTCDLSLGTGLNAAHVGIVTLKNPEKEVAPPWYCLSYGAYPIFPGPAGTWSALGDFAKKLV